MHEVGQQQSPDPSAVEASRAKVDRSTLAASGLGTRTVGAPITGGPFMRAWAKYSQSERLSRADPAAV